jgi:hypothetical protein
MGCVFLSHNHRDKPFVRLLSNDITHSGVAVWLDEIELAVGDSILIKIAEALSEAEYVVAFLSPNSINSKWVQKELSVATTLSIKGGEIRVLPLLMGDIDDKDIPIFLMDQLYADFRHAQHYDIAFRSLLGSISPQSIPARVLTLDTFRKQKLVDAAVRDGLHDWVVDYLTGTISQRADPVERYWSYQALAEIGGERALKSIEAGLADIDEFAVLGAQEALNFIRNGSTKRP